MRAAFIIFMAKHNFFFFIIHKYVFQDLEKSHLYVQCHITQKVKQHRKAASEVGTEYAPTRAEKT